MPDNQCRDTPDIVPSKNQSCSSQCHRIQLTTSEGGAESGFMRLGEQLAPRLHSSTPSSHKGPRSSVATHRISGVQSTSEEAQPSNVAHSSLMLSRGNSPSMTGNSTVDELLWLLVVRRGSHETTSSVELILGVKHGCLPSGIILPASHLGRKSSGRGRSQVTSSKSPGPQRVENSAACPTRLTTTSSSTFTSVSEAFDSQTSGLGREIEARESVQIPISVPPCVRSNLSIFSADSSTEWRTLDSTNALCCSAPDIIAKLYTRCCLRGQLSTSGRPLRMWAL